MQFQGALIKEQNVTFAIAIVKLHVINNTQESDNARRNLIRVFSGVPIILMAQDYDGTPTYQGRKDIVNYLACLHISQIPWGTYTYS